MSTTEAQMIDEEFLDRMVHEPGAVHRGGGATIVESAPGEGRRLTAAGSPAAVAALMGKLNLTQIGSITVPRGTWELLDPALREALDLPEVEEWDWLEIRHAPSAPSMENVREVDLETERAELERVRNAAIPTSFLAPDERGSRWYGWFDDTGTMRALGGAIGSVDGHWPQGAHYGSIGTHPQWRGRGIGAALTAGMVALAFKEGATSASLGVYTSNTRAIEMYRRLGFTTRYRIHSRRHSE